MDFILQETFDAKNPKQFNFKPGRIAAIRGVITGKNATSETGDLSNCGSIIVTLREEQIANVSIKQLVQMLDIDRGSNLFSSTEASDFLASFTLDFLIRQDVTMLNALSVAGQSELNFEYVPAGNAASTFDNLTMKIYAEKAAYNERYVLKTLRDNQNEDAAVASKSYQLNKSNIANIFLNDVDDVISLVQLEQSQNGNQRTVLSPVDWNLLEAVTVGLNQIEDNASDMVKVPTATAGTPQSYVNNDSILYLTTSGAGAVEIVTQSLQWSRG